MFPVLGNLIELCQVHDSVKALLLNIHFSMNKQRYELSLNSNMRAFFILMNTNQEDPYSFLIAEQLIRQTNNPIVLSTSIALQPSFRVPQLNWLITNAALHSYSADTTQLAISLFYSFLAVDTPPVSVLPLISYSCLKFAAKVQELTTLNSQLQMPTEVSTAHLLEIEFYVLARIRWTLFGPIVAATARALLSLFVSPEDTLLALSEVNVFTLEFYKEESGMRFKVLSASVASALVVLERMSQFALRKEVASFVDNVVRIDVDEVDDAKKWLIQKLLRDRGREGRLTWGTLSRDSVRELLRR